MVNDSVEKRIPEIREELRKSIKEEIKESYNTPEFVQNVDWALLDSETKILSRLKAVEILTGIKKSTDIEYDERELNLPEQISILTEKIENIELSKPTTFKEPETIFPETKTEARAVFLKEYLDKEVKERNGQISLSGNEIIEFLTKIIPERYNPDFKVNPGQNIRKIKKDVIEKAAKLFPNSLFLNKNKNGRHETRILYKPLLTVTS